MKIKICGVTRPEDAEMIGSLGATHVGCVLAPESARAVTPAQAKEIFQAAGKKVTGVLVFRGGDAATMISTAKSTGAGIVQLEEAALAMAHDLVDAGIPIMRRQEVTVGTNMLPPVLPPPTAKNMALLQCAQIGTGLTFPWELLGQEAPAFTWIGGGVSPENVCALLTHDAFGMNACSSLEFRPGVMDPDRIQLLFETLEKGLAT